MRSPADISLAAVGMSRTEFDSICKSALRDHDEMQVTVTMEHEEPDGTVVVVQAHRSGKRKYWTTIVLNAAERRECWPEPV